MSNIKIFTAFHKEFEFPENKDIFIPIHAGKELSDIKLGMLWDNTWDNISAKNPNYCELTVLYWAWKNYDLSNVDYVWLSHYRRYFDIDEDLENNISKYDIIMPKKEYLWMLTMPMSIYQNYCYSHLKEDIDICINKIKELYPEYLDSINILGKRPIFYKLNKAYFYNMFIMKSTLFKEYCEWLFKILFECEKEIKISWYSYQARVFWFLWERLINVFIEKKKKEWIKILEVNLINKSIKC